MNSRRTRIVCFLVLCGPAVAGPAGRLEICQEHPHYFRDGDRHVVLVGVSDRDLFSVWRNEKGFSWQKYLDHLEACHINYVRQDVCGWGELRTRSKYPAQFSHPSWPFARAGPGKAVDGLPKFDLTRFEASYFVERLKPFLRSSARRGIYVELTLFEGFRTNRRFVESLFADENNINRLGLAPRLMTSDRALDNVPLLAIQHAYVDRILEETAEFSHIIYEISNETGGRQWVAHFIDYIHHHPTHPGRLVSAGEQTSAFDPRSGANDVVVKHRGRGGPYATHRDVQSHHSALLRYRVGKPVIHNEYFLFANQSTDDVDFPRKMMWGDFTAGGHSNFYDFSFWRGTGRTTDDGNSSRPPPLEILRGAKHLLDFLGTNDIPFWTMTPHDELAAVKGRGEPGDSIFTLARPGREYVSYVLGDGPVTVTLDLAEGLYATRWYDPKRGEFLTSGERLEGGARRLVHSPEFKQDGVLWVRALAGGR